MLNKFASTNAIRYFVTIYSAVASNKLLLFGKYIN